MLTPKQLKLLHAAKRVLKLDDDSYRDLLMRIAGADSAKLLNAHSFDLVITEFERLGFKNTARKSRFGHRPGMATPAQVAKMLALWAEYSGSNDVAALDKWLDHFHHISALRFVTAEKAAKIIPALRAMASRKKAA